MFEDVDGDGVRDPGEPGIANVTVCVTDAGIVETCVLTDGDGEWVVPGVPSGDATVEIDNSTVPFGKFQTAGDNPTTVSVAPGETTATFDGFQCQAACLAHVWLDINGDGMQQLVKRRVNARHPRPFVVSVAQAKRSSHWQGKRVPEPDLAGITVTIIDQFGGVHVGVTDVNGDVFIPNVPSGPALLFISVPPGLMVTTGNNPQNGTVPIGGSHEVPPIGVTPIMVTTTTSTPMSTGTISVIPTPAQTPPPDETMMGLSTGTVVAAAIAGVVLVGLMTLCCAALCCARPLFLPYPRLHRQRREIHGQDVYVQLNEPVTRTARDRRLVMALRKVK